MINLIPPKRLVDIRIAHSNTILLRYVQLLVVSLFVVLSALAVSYYFLHRRQQDVQAILTVEQKKVQQLELVQKDAEQLSATINTIAGLQSRNLKFSEMLTKIGSAMPDGTVLTGLQFSLENADAPLVISAEAENERLAAVLRDNLLTIGLFKTATIKNITLLEDPEETPQQPVDKEPATTGEPAAQAQEEPKPYRYSTTIATDFKDMVVSK